jgi:hypothetical protein
MSEAEEDELSTQTVAELTVNYLSPSWQEEEFVPILDLARWRTAMKAATLPPFPQEESQYAFKEEDGLLYRYDKASPDSTQRLWVPAQLRPYILRLFHDTPAAGHAGAKRMIGMLKELVWWHGMAMDVYTYCKTCEKCQQFKPHDGRTPMTSKPIPAKCLEDISMDVVGPVPSSWTGARYVLCIQDRLSRYLVFAPMTTQSADATARTFLNAWICQFGVPKTIVTDRGTNFMGDVFASLCKFLGTRHAPTCAYRPQGNAQNERAHKDLHTYLAMYLSYADKASWDSLLAQAAWVHNSSHHTVLGRSPFEVLTGMKPRNPLGMIKDAAESKEEMPSLAQYFKLREDQMEELRNETRLAIQQAQAHSQAAANKFSRNQNFQVGEEVWIKTHGNSFVEKKWGKKYDGPFVIKEIISPQVVRVFLKSDPSHENIVHVCYIRRRVTRRLSNEEDDEGQKSTSDDRLPDLFDSDDEDEQQPLPTRRPVQMPNVLPTTRTVAGAEIRRRLVATRKLATPQQPLLTTPGLTQTPKPTGSTLDLGEQMNKN